MRSFSTTLGNQAASWNLDRECSASRPVLSAHYPTILHGYTHPWQHACIVPCAHVSIRFQLPNRVGVAPRRRFLRYLPRPRTRDQRCVNANFTRSIAFSTRIIRYRNPPADPFATSSPLRSFSIFAPLTHSWLGSQHFCGEGDSAVSSGV